MSVRAQILVRQRDNFPLPENGRDPDLERVVWLYQDTDAHPSQIAEVLNRAFTLSITPQVVGYMSNGLPIVVDHSRSANQADYSASFICAAAPGQVVPRHDQRFYSGTDYVYVVDVGNMDDSEARPMWAVTLYRATRQFKQNPDWARLVKVVCSLPLRQFFDQRAMMDQVK